MIMFSSRKSIVVFVFFLIFIILGLLLIFLWSSLVDSLVKTQLSLANRDTMQYKNWIETPIDIVFEIYLFNWTNSEEFENGKKWTKPRFEEVGPYTYYQREHRENVKFNDNYTISFNSARNFIYAPELSKGSLDDEITVINPIAVSVANVVKTQPYLIRRGVHHFLEDFDITLAQTKTAEEFMFTGVNEILMDIGKKIDLKGFQIPYDKFGWFYGRNNSASYDGNYTMWTGEDDITKTGIITEWDGSDRTDKYEGECSRVDGTTGEVLHPLQKADEETLELFIPDVCSKLIFERNGSFTNKGIEGNLYVSTDKLFDNGTKYPEMACFSPGEVLKTGVRNISACQYKSPAFVSHPHFAYADESYRNGIEGMEPNLEKHTIHFVIEPTFGVPIKVEAVVQANLRMVQVDDLAMFENVEETMIPYLWCHVYGEVPDDYALYLRLGLLAPTIGTVLGYIFLCISIVLFSYFVYIEYKIRTISINKRLV